jgi:hypothetical protein
MVTGFDEMMNCWSQVCFTDVWWPKVRFSCEVFLVGFFRIFRFLGFLEEKPKEPFKNLPETQKARTYVQAF